MQILIISNNSEFDESVLSDNEQKTMLISNFEIDCLNES